MIKMLYFLFRPESLVTGLFPGFNGGTSLKHQRNEVLVENILQTFNRTNIVGVSHLFDQNRHVHVGDYHAVDVPNQH